MNIFPPGRVMLSALILPLAIQRRIVDAPCLVQ
jgi:hypothetical protein